MADTVFTPGLEVSEAHRFESNSPKLTQLLREPVDVKSCPGSSPKRLRTDGRLWLRKGSSAFSSPEWAWGAQIRLPVVEDGNLPTSVILGLRLPTPKGSFPFSLWDHISGSSSLFPTAAPFHFAKRVLTDEGRAQSRAALVVFMSLLSHWFLWRRMRWQRVGHQNRNQIQPRRRLSSAYHAPNTELVHSLYQSAFTEPLFCVGTNLIVQY